jgi:hypothetical protein
MKCAHVGKLQTFTVSFVLGSIVDLFHATAMASVVFYTQAMQFLLQQWWHT